MTGDPLLRLEKLSIARGGIVLASGIDLSVFAGQAVVLRGANGSGKTTLLRTIAGLQPAAAGHVHTDPETIAYGAHADGLKSTLTVTENLMFWGALYGHTDIDAALAAYDLDFLQNRMAGTLSAGQKRRLGLARLLVTGRPLWALDEPTVSLDGASVEMFAEAVRRHLKGGGAAILTTHIELKVDAEVVEMERFPPTDIHETDVFDEALS